jgi:hypothetical protein
MQSPALATRYGTIAGNCSVTVQNRKHNGYPYFVGFK